MYGRPRTELSGGSYNDSGCESLIQYPHMQNSPMHSARLLFASSSLFKLRSPLDLSPLWYEQISPTRERPAASISDEAPPSYSDIYGTTSAEADHSTGSTNRAPLPPATSQLPTFAPYNYGATANGLMSTYLISLRRIDPTLSDAVSDILQRSPQLRDALLRELSRNAATSRPRIGDILPAPVTQSTNERRMPEKSLDTVRFVVSCVLLAPIVVVIVLHWPEVSDFLLRALKYYAIFIGGWLAISFLCLACCSSSEHAPSVRSV
ncbi:uncharacterized protein PHACADRAFT_248344 [Phanerochaete carnosa HHB-10118-sp]|uniref:Uncharacterized protein n=1 Tax=Phanerochaete carnosa (strain HHB-10118-sp) TaxID=650164 RepID=K5VF30_PHACS|nr:uncharacterized protein PHACADRAFT_248344 [Phanerochaete carnosa HHB-10118-sp]EKM61631.1 hypothetical protein PHACADRAFT_248344 [Phanerochaete carnosa HHB-10118-sp]